MSKLRALNLNPTPAIALEPRLLEAADRVIAASESRNTTRAYNAAFAKFEAWCRRRSVMPLPAAPALVATYLVDLADTGAGETLAAGAKPAARSRSPLQPSLPGIGTGASSSSTHAPLRSARRSRASAEPTQHRRLKLPLSSQR